MVGTFKVYSLVESKLFTKQLSEIASIEAIDSALDAFYWSLCSNPHEWPLVPNSKNISLRVAKTIGFMADRRRIPSLRIFFSIIEDDSQVYLMSVEAV